MPLRPTALLLALLSLPWNLAAEPRPGDHVHGLAQCTDCHRSAIDFDTLTDAGRCRQCHSGVPAPGRPALRNKTPSPAESELSAFVPGTPLNPDSGMRYPLYAEDSRLGDAPNDMVLIPAGPFIRGTDNRLPDEGPQHTMYLPAFYIDIYEVTNLQYKRFIDETGRRSP